MKTQIVKADEHTIAKAALLIASGDVVAFPTETVYGLGADALNAQAVAKIFAVKNRPMDNPLIVHVSSETELGRIVTDVPPTAQKLIKQFWPGPLSIVLQKNDTLPSETTADLSTVVVRCPAHPIALQLIKTAKTPIAAPSANLSGHVSPTSAEHVYEDLNGKIPLILDGGLSIVGIESTVIDCTGDTPTLLRPGSITKEDIEEIIGKISVKTDCLTTTSPGMKYRHYAPKTKVLVFDTAKDLQAHIESLEATAVVLHHSDIRLSADCTSLPLPPNPEQAASSIYERLRTADEVNADYILVEGYPEEHIGTALMNRLRKAASG